MPGSFAAAPSFRGDPRRESLLLRGFAFHARYWDENDENAESVFAPIVRGAFVASPV